MSSISNPPVEEMIFLDLTSPGELIKIRNSAEFENFTSELASQFAAPSTPSSSPSVSAMIEIDLSPEQLSLTFKGLTIVLSIPQVKDIIFEGKTPTEDAARMYIMANPILVNGIEYIHNLVQIRNQKMAVWDELTTAIQDELSTGFENSETEAETLDTLPDNISVGNSSLKEGASTTPKLCFSQKKCASDTLERTAFKTPKRTTIDEEDIFDNDKGVTPAKVSELAAASADKQGN